MTQRTKYKIMEKIGGGIIFAKRRELRIKFAIETIRHFRGKWEKIAWVAPINQLDISSYTEKIKSSLGNMAADISFFAFERLSINDHVYIDLYELASQNKTFCVIDESLNIKNFYSEKTKRLWFLQKYFDYRLLLATEPICCDLLDIYTQLRFVEPRIFNMTRTQFVRAYLPQTQYWFKSRADLPQLMSEAEQKVTKVFKPYIMRCDLSGEVKINYYEYNFELEPAERQEYEKDKEEFLRGRTRVVYLQILHYFQYCYTICRQKVRQLQILLDEILQRNEKVIIYTKYLSEIKFFRESGLFKNIKFAVMCGVTNKLRAARLFEGNFNVLLCTYKVEIPRLILNDCTNVIYFSQTFDYKDKKYPLSRLCGDDVSELNIYDFWVDTTLENMIKQSLHHKKMILNNIYSTMLSDKVCN